MASAALDCRHVFTVDVLASQTQTLREEVEMNDQAIEQEILDKQLTSPRLSPEHIDDMIIAGSYHVFPGTTVTVCCLTLRNGTKLVGTNYGAIDPKQHDWDRGKQEAYNEAREQVWQLEGYLLRQRLHEQQGNIRGGS